MKAAKKGRCVALPEARETRVQTRKEKPKRAWVQCRGRALA